MPDYVPKKDSDFKAWLSKLVTALDAHKAEFGLLDADLAPLVSAESDFEAAIADHALKQRDARAATARKDSMREAAEEALRPLIRMVNNHKAMTNTLRVGMGLRARSGVHSTPGLVGDEIPSIFLETQPGAVIVHFGTHPTNEYMNGKPSWARGCNIYRKKAGEDGFPLLNFETASPYIDEITGPPAAYTYCVQYRGTRASDVGASCIPETIAAGGLLAA
jgi:hypothetical protein